MNHRSLLTLEVSGVAPALVGGDRVHAGCSRRRPSNGRRRRRRFVLALLLFLLRYEISAGMTFLSAKFHSFKSNPLSISSFVPSCCFHGYPSLRAVHYLSLPPFPALSLSLCSYLSHFAFISASLPPALSHTLLSPAFISLHFHLSFTFLSPSSLPFHHAGLFLSFFFFFSLLTYSEKVLSVCLSILHF